MSPMTGGSVPRPSAEAKTAFSELLPDDPAVATRPMFGNVAAFVNGNMFAGLFGEGLFVRLPEDERREVLARGGADFEPMPGRAMRGYVTVPPTWRSDPGPARGWIAASLAWTKELPAKEPRRARR